MRPVEVIQGLVIDEEMFQRAEAGVARYAPHIAPLTWETFTRSGIWINVPDASGELSKSELTLLIGEPATVKLNIWHSPDVRGGDMVVPHNHRWLSFTGHLLSGGYDEDRYTRRNIDPETGEAEVQSQRLSHHSPEGNEVAHDVFHEVVGIHDPGRTMSLVVCGFGKFGNWSHLDVETGKLRRDQPVKGFDAMLAALNPHKTDL